MTTYYVDATLSTGANDGSSTTDAWRSLQEAIDQINQVGHPTAGDVVLCRHTASPDETLAASIDVDGLTGTATDFIQWIGVNSSWVEDGTRYEIDGNSAAANCLNFNSATVDYTFWKHFVYTGATAHGVNHNTIGSSPHYFLNCIAHTNARAGFYGYRNTGGLYIGCLAYGNGEEGFMVSASDIKLLFCCSRDNTEEGFADFYGVNVLFYNCIAFDNTKNGFLLDLKDTMINCVSDNNTTSDLYINDSQTLIIGNRFTNAQTGFYGLDANSYTFISGYNYFEDNAAGNILDGTNEIFINLTASSTTNQFDQADTNEGYTSTTEGSENYELRTDATLFEAGIQIPTGQ